MQGFNLTVNWTGLIFKKPNQSIGRHKKLDTIKVFLGDGSENSTTANHVFFKEMILELVEKKTLMFSFRVNCREAAPYNDPIQSNVNSAHWGANTEKNISRFSYSKLFGTIS